MRIGPGLLARASLGTIHLEQPKATIVTTTVVAPLSRDPLTSGLSARPAGLTDVQAMDLMKYSYGRIIEVA